MLGSVYSRLSSTKWIIFSPFSFSYVRSFAQNKWHTYSRLVRLCVNHQASLQESRRSPPRKGRGNNSFPKRRRKRKKQFILVPFTTPLEVLSPTTNMYVAAYKRIFTFLPDTLITTYYVDASIFLGQNGGVPLYKNVQEVCFPRIIARSVI